MPADYLIDKQVAVMYTTLQGVVTAEDVIAVRNRYGADPDFSPDMKQLVDTRAVTDCALSTREIRLLAEQDPFMPGAQRAFVAPGDVAYGLAFMYEVMMRGAGGHLEVFREIDVAREWLEIDPSGS